MLVGFGGIIGQAICGGENDSIAHYSPPTVRCNLSSSD